MLNLTKFIIFNLLFFSLNYAYAETNMFLESPQSGSVESGIGLIRGWACEAGTITIIIDNIHELTAAYGTSRGDTVATCGDDNNGFGITFNWNLLGDGEHNLKAISGGDEFANISFKVKTLGSEFLRGMDARFTMDDFPNIGEFIDVQWSESHQNFVLYKEGETGNSGISGDEQHQLESPQVGSMESGIGLIRGWVCDATEIRIEIDSLHSFIAAYGTSRGDTIAVCADDNNGFGLTVNWNLLGDGEHRIKVYADNQEFADVFFNITTLGVEFLSGVEKQYELKDFPDTSSRTLVNWSQSNQNFIISDVFPQRIMVSLLRGNTALYDSLASFDIVLTTKPTFDVLIPVSSSNENEGIVTILNLSFTPENWYIPQTVVVKGRNNNVINGRQNYKILLGITQSQDPNFNDINVDDVEIKGIILVLSQPTDSLNFVAGLIAKINPNVVYTGDHQLTYSLTKNPDGMIINPDSGEITWEVPESAENNQYDIQVVASDDVLSESIDFSISIENIDPIQTIINGNTVHIISSAKCNFNGYQNMGEFSITVPPGHEDILRNIKVNKVDHTNLSYPNNVKIDSCIFSITGLPELQDMNYKISLPVYDVGDGNVYDDIQIYNYTDEVFDTNGYIWSQGVSNVVINQNNQLSIEYETKVLYGLFFIGHVARFNIDTNIVQNNKMRIRSTQNISNNISCYQTTLSKRSSILPYFSQIQSLGDFECILTEDNLPVFSVTIKNFGILRWKTVSVELLFQWLVDAKNKVDSYGLRYDKLKNIYITTLLPSNVFGQYLNNNLRLNGVNDISANAIKGTVAHEFFHHVQLKYMKHPKNALLWIIEGTARWFEDEVFDNNNTYIKKEAVGHKILEVGLNTTFNKSKPVKKARPYQRFSFFKLINSKCQDNPIPLIFKQYLLTASLASIDALKQSITNCNFGFQLGVDKKSSLEAALLYYQYATQYENRMSLLDANELVNNQEIFHFTQGIHYNNSSWTRNNGSFLLQTNISFIPAYGAYSVELEQDFWKDIISNNKEVILTITLANNSPPLTLSLLGINSASFLPDSFINSIPHRHKTITHQQPFTFNFGRQNGSTFFITLLNANNSKVTISKIEFKTRDIGNKKIVVNTKVINYSNESNDIFIELVKNDSSLVKKLKVDYKAHSPFELTFDGLDESIYQLFIYTKDVVLETKQINFLNFHDEPDENGLTHCSLQGSLVRCDFEFDMHVIASNIQFIKSDFLNKIWTIKNCSPNNNGSHFDIRFNDNGSVEEITSYSDAGFSETDEWSISNDGELLMAFNLFGTIISTITHAPINRLGDCYITNSTQTNSSWNNTYKMCKSLSEQEKNRMTCN